MAVHVGLMAGVDEIRSMYEGVTTTAAQVMHLGIKPGCDADLVVLQARDPRSKPFDFEQLGSTYCAAVPLLLNHIHSK